jgi:hypothetical protein
MPIEGGYRFTADRITSTLMLSVGIAMRLRGTTDHVLVSSIILQSDSRAISYKIVVHGCG